MKFENTEVWGFEHALRAMRNPYDSWNKSDTIMCYANANCSFICKNNKAGVCIGEKDMELAKKLIKGGSEHRKFLRQIFVSIDITAPLYWWKEFDTYKVGTVANSCSTMHTITKYPFTKEMFEMGDYNGDHIIENFWNKELEILEGLRNTTINAPNAEDKKRYWKELIRLLPTSFLQKRTITMNYENIRSMVHQRKNHRLVEWSEYFIDWVRKLPYAEDFLFENI